MKARCSPYQYVPSGDITRKLSLNLFRMRGALGQLNQAMTLDCYWLQEKQSVKDPFGNRFFWNSKKSKKSISLEVHFYSKSRLVSRKLQKMHSFAGCFTYQGDYFRDCKIKKFLTLVNFRRDFSQTANVNIYSIAYVQVEWKHWIWKH